MYVIQANVLFVSPQVMSENLRIFYVFEKEIKREYSPEKS